MKKKIYLLVLIIIVAFFTYRFMFCYKVFPTKNTGNVLLDQVLGAHWQTTTLRRRNPIKMRSLSPLVRFLSPSEC